MSGPITQPGEPRRVLQPAERPLGKGAGQLLQAGAWLLLAGVVSVILIKTVFGGFSQHGVHTDGAWLLLVLALTCLPLGVFALLLGGAKWLSNRGR